MSKESESEKASNSAATSAENLAGPNNSETVARNSSKTACPKPDVNTCNTCSQSFKTSRELQNHKKKGHNAYFREVASGKFDRNIVWTITSSTDTSITIRKHYQATIIANDTETEFYRNICQNVKENLAKYVQGKIKPKRSRKTGVLRKELTASAILELRLPDRSFETEFTFEDLYRAENLNAKFINNVSRLHIATQLSILRRANLLDKDLCQEKRAQPKENAGNSLTFLNQLGLQENQKPKPNDTQINEALFSGEEEKVFICETCYTHVNNRDLLETHQANNHPKVWNTYFEINNNQFTDQDWAIKPNLNSNGMVRNSSNNTTAVRDCSKCTKCHKVVTPIAEFHKHILECGGDTTWKFTMRSQDSCGKASRRRLFGVRRKFRGILKRSIPTTPDNLFDSTIKDLDSDSIRKMISNLPARRISKKTVLYDSKNLEQKVGALNSSPNRDNKFESHTAAKIFETFSVDTPSINRSRKK